MDTAETLFKLVPLIFFAPVAGFLINIFLPYIFKLVNKLFGTKLVVGEKTAGLISVLAVASAFVVALLQAYALTLYNPGGDAPDPALTIWPWIHIGTLAINWAFRVDTLSVTMM